MNCLVLSLVRRERPFKKCNEERQVFGDRIPYDIEIDIEVRVDQAITHVDDIGPWYRGIAGPCFLRDFAGGFSNHLDILDYGQREFPVGAEIAPGSPGCKGPCLQCRIQHMSQPCEIILPHIPSWRWIGPRL